MSGTGNCYDNASVETFFKTIKAELIWRHSWPTRNQAEAGIFQYINGFYNTRRRHSYPGGISPLAFGFDQGMPNGTLMDAWRCNKRDGITGALIARGDLYLQLLEGPQEKLLAT